MLDKEEKEIVTEEDFELKSDFENKLELIENSDLNSHLGKITTFANKEDNDIKYFSKQKLSSSKSEAKKNILNLKKEKHLNHNNLINLIDFSTSIDKGWCFKYYLSKGFYDYYDNNLRIELSKRKIVSDYFSLDELYSILIQMVEGLNYLQLHEISHGNIKPEFIFINKFYNNFKLYKDFNNKISVYETQINNIVHFNDKIYMCPVIFNNIFKKQKKFEFNKYKSDSFSLGVTLLELANLNFVNDIYNFQEGEINEEILNNYISNLENKFGNQNNFINILKKLLELNEENRPDFIELYDYLTSNVCNSKIFENEKTKIKNIFEIKNDNFYENKKKINMENEGSITVLKYRYDEFGNKIEIEEPTTYKNDSDIFSNLYSNNSKVLSIKRYRVDVDGNKILWESKIFEEPKQSYLNKSNYNENSQIIENYNNNNNNNILNEENNELVSEIMQNNNFNECENNIVLNKNNEILNNKEENNILHDSYNKEEIEYINKSEVVKVKEINSIPIEEINNNIHVEEINNNIHVEEINNNIHIEEINNNSVEEENKPVEKEEEINIPVEVEVENKPVEIEVENNKPIEVEVENNKPVEVENNNPVEEENADKKKKKKKKRNKKSKKNTVIEPIDGENPLENNGDKPHTRNNKTIKVEHLEGDNPIEGDVDKPSKKNKKKNKKNKKKNKEENNEEMNEENEAEENS